MPVLVNTTKKTLVIHAIRGRTIVLGVGKRVLLRDYEASLGPIAALLTSGSLAIYGQPAAVEAAPVVIEQPAAVEAEPVVEAAPVVIEQPTEPEPESIISKRRGRSARTDD